MLTFLYLLRSIFTTPLTYFAIAGIVAWFIFVQPVIDR